MLNYLNPGGARFQKSLNSEIYVDKSMLIEKTNRAIDTTQRYLCLSRPRRFGKTMAAEMLSAYYSYGCEREKLFRELAIYQTSSYKEHIDQHDCILINVQEFLSNSTDVFDLIYNITSALHREFVQAYPTIHFVDSSRLNEIMKDVYRATGRTFIILIDEWDCLFREFREDLDAQKTYLDFLRMWFKDQVYVGLAYMTGILPIKKYGTHSALNMFYEYSMTEPSGYAKYFGFTEEEVFHLSEIYHAPFDLLKQWYDGYHMLYREGIGFASKQELVSMYSPKSLIEAITRGSLGTYWNQTETYEALKHYIQMNMDGLKDAIVMMLSGGEVEIRTETFANDMTHLISSDDVLTLLVHLGYLTYDESTKTVSIPNKEVSIEYVNAIRNLDWSEVMKSIDQSKALVHSIWSKQDQDVARMIEKVHQEISILQYNDENSLSCVIGLALYYAKEYYTMIREFPSGKGYADIVLIPRLNHTDKPAIVMELKWDVTAEGAIQQIKDRRYVDALKEYHGDLLLVGVNYNKKSKIHECVIEEFRIISDK